VNISDEAVEAALKVVGEVTDAGFVRQVLEAAAPHMLAAAWDEGEADGLDNAASNRGFNIEHKSNPYRSRP
jgi:hypothetical protein